jgi:DNA primase
MACMNIHSRTDGVYETLKDKIDLAEVVGRFADLVDHGRVKTCFCPLSEQSSGVPGFKIYDDSFYCFSCEAWGDVTSFWRMKHDLPSNWDAALALAREYNVELPRMDPEARKRYEERRRREETWTELAHANLERLLKR